MFRQTTLTAAPAILLALALAGCSGDAPAPTAPNAPVLARAGLKHPMPATRPITGHCETTFNPPPLPPPPVHRQIDTGTCQLAHLGRTSFYSVKDINFALGIQTTTEARFTAANGDVLRAVGSGTSAPGGPGRVRFSATLTFVGGTGRFANATGEIHIVGEANLATRTTALEIVDGWIAYAASDRSKA